MVDKETYKEHSTKIVDLEKVAENNGELRIFITIKNKKVLQGLGIMEKENNIKSHAEMINAILTHYFVWNKGHTKDFKDFKDTMLNEFATLKADVDIIKHLLVKEK